MSFLVDWFVEQRVIQVELQGNVTLAQIEDIIEHIDRHVEQGVAPIHIIMDMTHVTTHPSMIQIKKVSGGRKPDPRMGWTLVVGANLISRLINNALLQINNVRYRNFASYDDALAFLQEVDDTLSFQITS